MKPFLLLFIVLLTMNSVSGQPKASQSMDKCYRWRTQVDPSKERIAIDEAALTDQEIVEGIGCLLQLKGHTNKARFSGDTRNNYNRSQSYKPPKKPASVEIAALYYASYLYTNNWEHAGSVVLYDESTGKMNTNGIVDRAFKSYRAWFKKVQETGLQQAREQKLDPLNGSGIAWS